MTTQSSQMTGRQWWSYGHVWMVIAGPLLVVIASFVTFYLAANGQDPVLTHSQASESESGAGNALAPAIQARNHAATGELPAAKSTNKP
ncbi:nitrogen fixation protein FixH [Limnohabitans sp. Jir72]|uniref:nitrogen fixation protein FixH n=1 Tax=Limnohabitans sp. Jir72 TaxID=1977909 RepID=UPI000D353E41|nr:nitrogen fixation protein FixH [Limnohabitans sp. Jir72]PUE35956.1 nitrogen fixation protein FixH [Limnohabitans sp. Jir72]